VNGPSLPCFRSGAQQHRQFSFIYFHLTITIPHHHQHTAPPHKNLPVPINLIKKKKERILLYDRESSVSRCDYPNLGVRVNGAVINKSEMIKEDQSAPSVHVTGRSEEKR
jgi:hypothetical protein